MKIAIIQSLFNLEFTQKMLNEVLNYLKNAQVLETDIEIFQVPGAVEIPVTCKKLAKTKRYEVLIAIGAVIFGETDHYQYVCRYVTDGCREVALSCEIPLIFSILTLRNKAQAEVRINGVKANMGRDAAEAALNMVALFNKIAKL